MQTQGKIDDSELNPSFSCYSLTSTAAAKVSCEFKQEQEAQFPDFGDIDDEDFEFSLVLAGEEVSGKEFDLGQRNLFPVFSGDLLMRDEVDRAVEENDDPFSVMIPLHKLFVESPSSSSSDGDGSEGKADGGSPNLIKCKKSSSTGSGSGSRKWRIRDMLRRSNSEGKELVFFLCPKKVEASKQKRRVNAGEVRKVTGNLKTTSSASFHELVYVQKREEKEGNKMKSYLPYRQDLLGFFANANGSYGIGSKKLSS